MSTVMLDIHGKLIRTNGNVYRPLFPNGYAHSNQSTTRFEVGDKVKAKAISGSPLARVDDEVWFNHGSYYDANAKVVPTTACFKPSCYNWS